MVRKRSRILPLWVAGTSGPESEIFHLRAQCQKAGLWEARHLVNTNAPCIFLIMCLDWSYFPLPKNVNLQNSVAVPLHEDCKRSASEFLQKISGTKTEFCVPDHGSWTVTMAKFRAFMQNPDLFRTTFLTFPDF